MQNKYLTFSKREIFNDRFALLTLILIIIHQSIIASAAYFLTGVIEKFQSNQRFEFDLLLYFTAMAIPFFPGCASYVTLKKWENSIHSRFVAKIQLALSGRTGIYKNTDTRNNVVGMVSRNSFAIVSSFCSYLHSSLTFFLNSTLSIAVIAAILPRQLVTGYIVSGLFSVVIIYFSSPIISRKAKTTENSNMEYGEMLANIWPNTSLGNSYNERVWHERVRAKGEKFYRDIVDVTTFRQLNNLTLGLAALLPSMYLIYMTATADAVTASVFAAIIVNLTRIIHILNSFGALVYQVLDLKSVTTRIEMLDALLSKVQNTKASMVSKPLGPVHMNGVAVENFAKTAEQLERSKTGRFVITGDNGAGKSMLLLHLKNHFARSAFLLPVDMQGIQWRQETSKLSTGQRIISVLGELAEDAEYQVLLLDEWDANLDKTNKAAISSKLDAIATGRIVVEVRHALI